jgi:excisionase family DNA binding protein
MMDTSATVEQDEIGQPVKRRGFATSSEAARFLRVTRQHVSKLVSENKIPHQRFGRSLRIPWVWVRKVDREIETRTATGDMRR